MAAESREQRAESREQRAESREQRAESREQRAESREQRIVAAVDLSVKQPGIIKVANCITARENRGICNRQKMGNGVVIAITKKFSKLM